MALSPDELWPSKVPQLTEVMLRPLGADRLTAPSYEQIALMGSHPLVTQGVTTTEADVTIVSRQPILT